MISIYPIKNPTNPFLISQFLWKKVGIAFILFNLAGISLVLSQGYSRWDSIPVQIGNQTLKFPWCGGLNNAQVYSIDLNGDGLKDMFTYDRTSMKHRTYLNTGGSGMYRFKYAPQYESRFPGPFNNWVQLFDFNCDGKEDIFTYKNGYIQVWKNNYSVANGLNFSLYASILSAHYGHATYSGILINAQSVPTFSDVDNDGDLDLLIYGIQATWYQNMAEENYSRCDTLDFNLADNCWGKFSSAANPNFNKLNFNIACRSTTDAPDSSAIFSSSNHAGQSILAIDLNGDGLKDILVGDMIQNNITAGYNTGTAAAAKITSQDTAFPSNTIPIRSFTLNTCDYLDVDNDGVKDLLVSPYQPNTSANFNSVSFYKNNGTTNFPVFGFQQDNFMQSEMIEVGEGAAPVFFDYNSDGLQDMVIGNYGYYNTNYVNGFQTNLSLYKNTGTTTSPQFKLVTRNYAGLDSLGVNWAYPTFGDLDGDGDEDMIVGYSNGRLIYFNNSAGAGNPAVFQMVSGFYDSISVGQFATPQLIDVNRDRKLDLVIGNRNGKLSYYQNIGSPFSPYFSSVPTSANFGRVDVTKAGYVTGFSVPCMFDSAGRYILLVGSESGYIYKYGNIDGNLSGTFTKKDTSYMKIWEGLRSTPTVKDINGDGLPDLILGNYSGGVSFFRGDITATVREISVEEIELKLWPNPASGIVNLFYSISLHPAKIECVIYNMLGEIIEKHKLSPNEKYFSLDISRLPSGIYICKLVADNLQQVRKLVVEK